jgi:hypothetical protein
LFTLKSTIPQPIVLGRGKNNNIMNHNVVIDLSRGRALEDLEADRGKPPPVPHLGASAETGEKAPQSGKLRAPGPGFGLDIKTIEEPKMPVGPCLYNNMFDIQ